MRGPPGRHQRDLGWMVQHCRTGGDGRAGISLGAISVSWDCVYVLSERGKKQRHINGTVLNY